MDDDHDVYPVHLLDNATDYRNLFMSYLFRFNDVLDSDKLADSLTKLLRIGHWRKLSGRLRLKVGNFITFQSSPCKGKTQINEACKLIPNRRTDNSRSMSRSLLQPRDQLLPLPTM